MDPLPDGSIMPSPAVSPCLPRPLAHSNLDQVPLRTASGRLLGPVVRSGLSRFTQGRQGGGADPQVSPRLVPLPATWPSSSRAEGERRVAWTWPRRSPRTGDASPRRDGCGATGKLMCVSLLLLRSCPVLSSATVAHTCVRQTLLLLLEYARAMSPDRDAASWSPTGATGPT